MNAKALIHSKTFWFGLAQIAFGAIGYVFHFIDPQTALSLVASGFATIGLRVGTSQPISSVLPQ